MIKIISTFIFSVIAIIAWTQGNERLLLFDYAPNAYQLTLDQKSDLSKAFGSIQNRRVSLQAHAGDMDDEDANYILSLQRGQALRDYLLMLGVDSAQVQIYYFGSTQPQLGRSEEDRFSHNRRVLLAVGAAYRPLPKPRLPLISDTIGRKNIHPNPEPPQPAQVERMDWSRFEQLRLENGVVISYERGTLDEKTIGNLRQTQFEQGVEQLRTKELTTMTSEGALLASVGLLEFAAQAACQLAHPVKISIPTPHNFPLPLHTTRFYDLDTDEHNNKVWTLSKHQVFTDTIRGQVYLSVYGKNFCSGPAGWHLKNFDIPLDEVLEPVETILEFNGQPVSNLEIVYPKYNAIARPAVQNTNLQLYPMQVWDRNENDALVSFRCAITKKDTILVSDFQAEDMACGRTSPEGCMHYKLDISPAKLQLIGFDAQNIRAEMQGIHWNKKPFKLKGGEGNTYKFLAIRNPERLTDLHLHFQQGKKEIKIWHFPLNYAQYVKDDDLYVLRTKSDRLKIEGDVDALWAVVVQPAVNFRNRPTTSEKNTFEFKTLQIRRAAPYVHVGYEDDMGKTVLWNIRLRNIPYSREAQAHVLKIKSFELKLRGLDPHKITVEQPDLSMKRAAYRLGNNFGFTAAADFESKTILTIEEEKGGVKKVLRLNKLKSKGNGVYILRQQDWEMAKKEEEKGRFNPKIGTEEE